MAEARLDLIRLLDELVRADPHPPGFQGRVCLGVRGDATRWWSGTFAERATSSISDDMPVEFDVAVGLEEREIDRLLDGDIAGIITGDRDLWLQFLRRYVRVESLLGLRAKRSKERG